MLDDVLVREIRRFLGTGSTREERVKVNQTIRAAAADLGKITRYDDSPLYECLKKYDRGAVSVCIASTLYEQRERLDKWGLNWSLEVLRQWTWRDRESTMRGLIRGNAHPTLICEWARDFIEVNWV